MRQKLQKCQNVFISYVVVKYDLFIFFALVKVYIFTSLIYLLYIDTFVHGMEHVIPRSFIYMLFIANKNIIELVLEGETRQFRTPY